jgi:K+/H+ antiporter YhaU regulatory subunit KhtT
MLETGDTLIFIGDPEQLSALKLKLSKERDGSIA